MRIAAWLTHDEAECWNFRPRHARRLEELVEGARVRIVETAEGLRAELRAGAEVALAWKFEPAWLAEASRLRVVATPAAGRDLLGLEPREGLRVLHGSFHGEIMAETVVGMMLSLSRGIIDAARGVEGDPWPRARLEPRLRLLRGSRVTILGYGSIGRWIARRLAPFGARITGVRRRVEARARPEARDGAQVAGVRVVASGELDTLLSQSEWLIIVLPAEPATDRIVDARRLALLPPGASVINVGRGNAIDEPALACALRSGRLRAACLDVFREEPLPAGSPLRHCPNVLLMPHVSAVSPNYLDLFVEELGPALTGR